MSKTKFSKVLALVIMLALVIGVLPIAASATVPAYNNIQIQFGDPDYDPTWPESLMSLREDDATTHTYTALYDGDEESTFYPSIVSLYAFYNTNNGVTLTSNNTSNIQFVTYDQYGNETVDIDGVMNYSQNSNWNPNANGGQGGYVSSNLFAIKINGSGSITLNRGNNQTVTIVFQNPRSSTASGDAKPKTVNGYLPIGQFARPNSMGWGTIYTDNTNIYTTAKTPKFTNGYVTTGVSLGVLGGYVQFEFQDAIGNDDDNPYGIDFIVYGNAFNGNPEAGAVMVRGKVDGTNNYGWYNLAGSRHYMSGTTKSTDITYVKITGTAQELALNEDFTAAGIYYSRDFVKPASDSQSDVDSAIGSANWTSITTATGWWPENDNNEYYDDVWKMHRPDASTPNRTGIDGSVDGVYWYSNGTAQVIRYEGVTEVIDSNTTDDYRWGYADVRANGTNYGVAVNPYATAPSAANGGDGFDISWAVDADGLPVKLTDVRFVRVYSAVLFNAGVFGETSTEVCGIYVASGEGDGANNATTLELKKLYATNPTTMNANAITEVKAGTYKFKSSDTYVFKNGEQVTDAGTSSGHSITIAVGQYIQIISQSGTRSPFITVLKGVN